MAEKHQIEELLARFHEAQPLDILQKIDKTQMGIGAVLRYLYESTGRMTAGSISRAMGVSTARVAVLLKKMEAQGLIVKEHDAVDARVTVVRLAPKGEAAVESLREDIYRQIAALIDQVGMERIDLYLAIAKEIRGALTLPVSSVLYHEEGSE